MPEIATKHLLFDSPIYRIFSPVLMHTMQHKQTPKPPRKKLKAFFRGNSFVSVLCGGANLQGATFPVDTTSHNEQYSSTTAWRPKSLICQNMQKNAQTLALVPHEPTMANCSYENDTESDSDHEDAVIPQKNAHTPIPAAVLTADAATVQKPAKRTVKYTFVVGSDVRGTV